jgi:hypothetical protein
MKESKMQAVRKHLSYANVMATMALFLALGGSAYAISKAPKNTVTSKSIKAGAVRTGDLHRDAVTGDKVAKKSLTGADIDVSSLGFSDVQRTGTKMITSYPAGAPDSAQATCQAGEHVVGGGGFATSSQVDLYESKPISSTTWQASFNNESGVTLGSVQLTAVAICASP